MAHTYSQLLYHCIFSTKSRARLLSAEIRQRLWPYMGGIARENGATPLSIGGVEDHAHLLLSLPAAMPVAKAVQLVKGGSSKWLSQPFPSLGSFEWQEGYGAFTIGVSHRDDTMAYIGGQEEHHRRKSYKEEFLEILKKHGIEYDERYLWG